MSASKSGGAHRIARNTLFLTLSDAAARLSTLVLIIFFGRMWEASLYGQYAVAVNWVAIFAVASELGLNALMVREVAHRKHQASFFLRHVLVIRSAFSFVFWALLIVIAWGLHYEGVLILAMGVMGLRLILDSMEGGYIYLFQAHQEMGPYSLVNILCAAIRLVGIVLVVSAGAQVVGAGSIWVVASAVGFFAMMTLAHRRGWRPDFSKYQMADSMKIFRMAIPLAAFGTLQTLYYRVDSVMLKSLSGNEAVGYYDMAMRVLLYVLSISQLYSQAIYPALASVRDKAAQFSGLAMNGSKVLFMLALPMTVGGYFLAGPMLTLICGPRYAPSGPAFAILALSILPFFAANIYVDILAIKDTTKLNLQFAFLFILNVGLNYLFIPRWGIEGAAWATVVCEYLGVVTGFYLAGRFLRPGGLSELLKPFVVSVVSCGVMAAGLILWPGLHWLILGPIVYGAGVLLLGGVDRRDWESLTRR